MTTVGDPTRLMDLSALPEAVLQSLDNGPLATASVSQRRMAIHIATPEGQAWVAALRAVDTPSPEVAKKQVGSALRGLSLSARDPVPPELSLCAVKHPTTGRYYAEPTLAMGGESSLQSGLLIRMPRYRPETPGHVISVSTQTALGVATLLSGYAGGRVSDLSTSDETVHAKEQAALARSVRLTTASVDVLSGQITSLTGPEQKMDLFSPTVLNEQTILDGCVYPTMKLIEAIRQQGGDTCMVPVAPRGSQTKLSQAVQHGWDAAGKTQAAKDLAALNRYDTLNRLPIGEAPGTSMFNAPTGPL